MAGYRYARATTRRALWNVDPKLAVRVVELGKLASKTSVRLARAFTDMSVAIADVVEATTGGLDSNLPPAQQKALLEMGRDLEDAPHALMLVIDDARKTFERLKVVAKLDPAKLRLRRLPLPRDPQKSPVRDLQSHFQRIGRLSENLAEILIVAAHAGDRTAARRAKKAMGSLASFTDTIGSIVGDLNRGIHVARSGQYRLGSTAKRLPPRGSR